jgi:NAD(P)H-dependent flavin oxidoreductase YrpB (nitropropane dioxygenase family)
LETGGLSGPPLFPFALSALRTLRTLLPAEIHIIGCGGIATGSDALAFAKAGASTVQFYTTLTTDGAGAVRRIKDEVVKELENNPNEGMTWAEMVQSAIRELAGTHPERYQARQAKAAAQHSEETLIVEAEELKREAEDLKYLLAQAGLPGSEALTEGLRNRDIDKALKAMVLEAPSDARSLQNGDQKPAIGGRDPGAASEVQPAETTDTSKSSTIPYAPASGESDDADTAVPQDKALTKVI